MTEYYHFDIGGRAVKTVQAYKQCLKKDNYTEERNCPFIAEKFNFLRKKIHS